MSGVLNGLATAPRTISAATGVVSGTIGLANDISSFLGSGPIIGGIALGNGSGTPWYERLQPATWRGLEFAVRSSEYTGGRRVAMHEYPYRDLPWAEDLGRATRVFTFSGFVIGDDCVSQASDLMKAGETKGPGTLCHPSLGSFLAVLVTPIRATERGDLGRVVELTFEFVQVKKGFPTFPAVSTDSAAAAQAAATSASATAGGTFLSSIGSAISSGATAVSSVVRTVSGFASTVGKLAGDAALVTHAASGLIPGVGTTFGRYGNGARGSLLTGVSTVSQALSVVTAARTTVSSACAACNSLATIL